MLGSDNPWEVKSHQVATVNAMSGIKISCNLGRWHVGMAPRLDIRNEIGTQYIRFCIHGMEAGDLLETWAEVQHKVYLSSYLSINWSKDKLKVRSEWIFLGGGGGSFGDSSVC